MSSINELLEEASNTPLHDSSDCDSSHDDAESNELRTISQLSIFSRISGSESDLLTDESRAQETESEEEEEEESDSDPETVHDEEEELSIVLEGGNGQEESSVNAATPSSSVFSKKPLKIFRSETPHATVSDYKPSFSATTQSFEKHQRELIFFRRTNHQNAQQQQKGNSLDEDEDDYSMAGPQEFRNTRMSEQFCDEPVKIRSGLVLPKWLAAQVEGEEENDERRGEEEEDWERGRPFPAKQPRFQGRYNYEESPQMDLPHSEFGRHPDSSSPHSRLSNFSRPNSNSLKRTRVLKVEHPEDRIFFLVDPNTRVVKQAAVCGESFMNSTCSICFTDDEIEAERIAVRLFWKILASNGPLTVYQLFRLFFKEEEAAKTLIGTYKDAATFIECRPHLFKLVDNQVSNQNYLVTLAVMRFAHEVIHGNPAKYRARTVAYKGNETSLAFKYFSERTTLFSFLRLFPSIFHITRIAEEDDKSVDEEFGGECGGDVAEETAEGTDTGRARGAEEGPKMAWTHSLSDRRVRVVASAARSPSLWLAQCIPLPNGTTIIDRSKIEIHTFRIISSLHYGAKGENRGMNLNVFIPSDLISEKEKHKFAVDKEVHCVCARRYHCAKYVLQAIHVQPEQGYKLSEKDGEEGDVVRLLNFQLSPEEVIVDEAVAHGPTSKEILSEEQLRAREADLEKTALTELALLMGTETKSIGYVTRSLSQQESVFTDVEDVVDFIIRRPFYFQVIAKAGSNPASSLVRFWPLPEQLLRHELLRGLCRSVSMGYARLHELQQLACDGWFGPSFVKQPQRVLQVIGEMRNSVVTLSIGVARTKEEVEKAGGTNNICCVIPLWQWDEENKILVMF